jgi:hypothetical protein
MGRPDQGERCVDGLRALSVALERPPGRMLGSLPIFPRRAGTATWICRSFAIILSQSRVAQMKVDGWVLTGGGVQAVELRAQPRRDECHAQALALEACSHANAEGPVAVIADMPSH